MKYDDFLVKYIGEFGPYQKLQYFLVCFPAVFVSLQVLSWTFTGAKLDHRCIFVNENLNSSFFFNLSGFTQSDFQCSRPANLTFEELELLAASTNLTQLPSENFCADGYRWDFSEVKYSAINRWEIVCNRRWIRATVQAMYYIGQAIGALSFGFIADRFGRKVGFIVAIITQSVSGLLMAFVPWIEMFAFLRLLSGFAHPGAFGISVVIGMELVGPSKRYIGGVATGTFFAIGQVLLAALAYGIRNYQHLQLAISIPYLFFLVYWWIIPESARWLIAQNRIDEAEKVLRRAAQMNKRKLPPDWNDLIDSPQQNASSSSQSGDVRQYNYFDLFRTRGLFIRSIIAFFCWPTVSMVYYGISMNPSLLGGDTYMNFAIAGVVEIPGVLLAGLTINYLGRKILAISGYFIAGVCLMLTLAAGSHQWIMTTLVMIAKMFATMEYAVQYVFTPEMFPTVVRNLGMGVCSMMARVGAVSASYMIMYLADDNKTAVVMTFGICSLIAAVLSFLQPETNKARGLETIEDAEQFSRTARPFSFKCPVQFQVSSTKPDISLRTMVGSNQEKEALNKQSL